MIALKRIYDRPEADDGYRVLVDRLWPRGVKREHADLDAWLQSIAPSDELRTWFHHDVQRWELFVNRYKAELSTVDAIGALTRLSEIAKHRKVTLLFEARSRNQNNAVVIRDLLVELAATG